MKIETAEQLAGVIDHTLLGATVTAEQIKRHCEEARRFGFCAVCVNPRWVGLAAEMLGGSGVKVQSVAGFPLGAELTEIKAAQARRLIEAGAEEIDMVADLASIIERDVDYLSGEVCAVVEVCRSAVPRVGLKVIIEAAALGREQKLFACEVIEQAGADFIKTSTGLHPAGGASVEDVRLIKEAAPRCKVKAAGGIRNVAQVLDMLDAGADRIGTSSGVKILEEFKAGGR